MKRTLLVLTAIAGVAHADARKPKPKPGKPIPVEPEPEPPKPEVTTPKPWAEGVSQDNQRKAEAIFAEGNTLFSEQEHAGALAKYREAIAIWNHPLIQFNLAVTLIRLDRILEAADHLEKALAYGAAPFKPELYQQATDYQTLLKGRIGYVAASCAQPDVSVLLDGKQWFACPGTQKQRVMAGEHTLVSERKGYLTSSRRLVVAGGATLAEKITLVSLDAAVTLEYPYRRWLPWTLTATGAAIALGGVGFWFVGRNEMTEFDNNFARDCTRTGCEHDLSEHAALRAQRDASLLKGTVGITMMIAGGAVTVGGIVMTIMNRPKRVLPNIEVAPTAGGMKAAVGWSF